MGYEPFVVAPFAAEPFDGLPFAGIVFVDEPLAGDPAGDVVPFAGLTRAGAGAGDAARVGAEPLLDGAEAPVPVEPLT